MTVVIGLNEIIDDAGPTELNRTEENDSNIIAYVVYMDVTKYNSTRT